jgi:hypothetical protein
VQEAAQACVRIPDGNRADLSAGRDISSAAAVSLREPCNDVIAPTVTSRWLCPPPTLFKVTGKCSDFAVVIRKCAEVILRNQLMPINDPPQAAAFLALSYSWPATLAGVVEEIRWR